MRLKQRNERIIPTVQMAGTYNQAETAFIVDRVETQTNQLQAVTMEH